MEIKLDVPMSNGDQAGCSNEQWRSSWMFTLSFAYEEEL